MLKNFTNRKTHYLIVDFTINYISQKNKDALMTIPISLEVCLGYEILWLQNKYRSNKGTISYFFNFNTLKKIYYIYLPSLVPANSLKILIVIKT